MIIWAIIIIGKKGRFGGLCPRDFVEMDLIQNDRPFLSRILAVMKYVAIISGPAWSVYWSIGG